MNEQLIVKNFGPIKDATVDFKRVTVFIGPTGGGKSTLAKLAAIFRDTNFYSTHEEGGFNFFKDFYIHGHFTNNSVLTWTKGSDSILVQKNTIAINENLKNKIDSIDEDIPHHLFKKFFDQVKLAIPKGTDINDDNNQIILEREFKDFFSKTIIGPIYSQGISPSHPSYIPSERGFIPAIEYSWAGLMRDDIGLSKIILDFANSFSTSRKFVTELFIPFFNITYQHINGRDFIKIPELEEPLALLETASGIQSVTPLLVLLENLTRNSEQVQSFIVEEPELNLYPAAQQGLLNWLIEKCTSNKNDLTVTTHSPYILSHLNLLLYAFQVAEKHPDRADDVAKIVPRESWINPNEFSAYYVNGPEGENGVRSLVDDETKLISRNGLDTVSGLQADLFDQLLDINSGF